MDKILIKNCVFIAKYLTNITEVLLHLIQHRVITQEEREIIESKATTFSKSDALITTLRRKDSSNFSIFVNILRETGNDHLVSKLQNTVTELNLEHLVFDTRTMGNFDYCNEPGPSNRQFRAMKNDFTTQQPLEISGNNYEKQSRSSEFTRVPLWWPEEKILVNNFYERKVGESSFVQLLLQNLENNENKTAVISQNVALSGLGGIGKTTIAIWFAVSYQKKYDRIIWIDCGEENLSPCFQKLAKYLGADDSQELKQLALSSFEKLAGQKCLLIYDNAECYIGKEGIKGVLPRPKNNFHCLITSRSTHWKKNGEHFKITPFEIQIFDSKDSVEFLKRNLIRSLQTIDILRLKELADLLGNLPLALQIAVATLNDGDSLTIDGYIKRISVTDEIIESHYDVDDYEKSIYNALKVSLEKIQKMGNGSMAYKILSTFGYVRPDDAKLDFFAVVEDELVEVIDYSVDLLTKFSLVSRTGVMEYYVTEDTDDCEDTFAEEYDPDDDLYFEKRGKVLKQSKLISIHRLLQQVIRYHVKELEREILTKILTCKGFLDSKLLPYKYTEKHEGLSEEFKHVRNELIYEMEIKIFLKERRYTEAAELSKLIYANCAEGSAKYLSSWYNYAVCLVMNNHLEEALKIFEKLFLKLRYKNEKIVLGLMNLEEVANRYTVALWCIQLQLALGHSEDTGRRSKLQLLNKLDFIDIRGNALPFNCKIFQKHQIKSVLLFGVKINWESLKMDIESSANPFRIEVLQLRESSFVDNDGEILDEVDFENVAISSKKLYLSSHHSKYWSTSTIINVDVSKIGETVETLNLHRLKIKCSSHNSHIKFLMLRDLYNSSEEIHRILPKFKSLLKLTLALDNIHFELNLSKIPITVKRLLLFNIVNVTKDSASESLELQMLSLKSYDISNIGTVETLVMKLKPQTVIVNLIWSNNPEYFFAKKERIKKLIDLCAQQQRSIGFGGHLYESMDLKTHLDLQKYGIEENSNYYLIEGMRGKSIDRDDFDKLSEQDW